MRNTVRTLALAAVLAGAFSTSAAAQQPARSNTTGLALGVFLDGSAIEMEINDGTDIGRGGGLHLGYGVHPNASVFMRVTAAVADPADEIDEPYALAHFDVGARISFGSRAAALRPFVQGAISGLGYAEDQGTDGLVEARGSGFSAAAGLEYFINRDVAVETGFGYSRGDCTEMRRDGGEWVDFQDQAFDASSIRFDLGTRSAAGP